MCPHVLSQVTTCLESFETTIKRALVRLLASVHARVRLQSVYRSESFTAGGFFAYPRLAVTVIF